MGAGTVITHGRRLRWLAALAAGLASLASAAATGLVGQPAPDFALKSTAGANLRLSEFRGQPVLVTFWAQWCGRCPDQLGALASLQASQSPEGLRVLAINLDTAPGPAREAAARYPITILHDADQAVARQYDPANLPFAVLVDAHGQVRQVFEQYRPGDEAAYADSLAALANH